jgi:hypothetical protein
MKNRTVDVKWKIAPFGKRWINSVFRELKILNNVTFIQRTWMYCTYLDFSLAYVKISISTMSWRGANKTWIEVRVLAQKCVVEWGQIFPATYSLHPRF